MTGPRRAAGKKSDKNVSSLEQGLDRSRKHKLWLTSNTIGVIVLISFVALAISRIVNDIRGEYTGHVGRLGFVRFSLDHRDGKLTGTLSIPHINPLQFSTPETNVGENVDWSFSDAYKPGVPVVSFHGSAQTGTLSGVLQDNLNVLNCFPIKLQRDDLASIFRQIRVAIPGSQEGYQPKDANDTQTYSPKANRSTR